MSDPCSQWAHTALRASPHSFYTWTPWGCLKRNVENKMLEKSCMSLAKATKERGWGHDQENRTWVMEPRTDKPETWDVCQVLLHWAVPRDRQAACPLVLAQVQSAREHRTRSSPVACNFTEPVFFFLPCLLFLFDFRSFLIKTNHPLDNVI